MAAEPRLVEVSSLPVFYIDGVARVQVTGPILRVTSYELRKVHNEIVKMPVLEIIRPLAVNIPLIIQQMIEKELAFGLETLAHH